MTVISKKTDLRLGVDIGGTFTDVVLETNTAVFSSKVLTDHGSPENAIFNGIYTVCNKGNVEPSSITQIIHGTTLATNALIEKTGAKTALITTKGFRDVIEMRTESRFEQYDLNLKMPLPLITRQHRYVVDERIGSSGNILISANIDAITRLISEIKKSGYESIAVGLIHSYANNTHEVLIKKIIEEQIPEVMVSLSSQVSPQMREYERFNTVSANAYVKPLIKRYLVRFQKRLISNNITCPVFLMHSGGGLISLETAAEFPVRLIESGPAGGAVFAATIAKKFGIKNTLSFDMGGTTAKICLIKNQVPKTSRVFEVARSYRFKKGSGMPISIPVIDMVEIGAGGGSIAHVDELNQIRVGPTSAGSEPGPACYGQGAKTASVTDADLILGKLDKSKFAGGKINLNISAAKSTIKKTISEKLNVSTKVAAFGISEVVDENMANAARVHAIENGENLSDYTIIAFGGAAPIHAERLCEKLGIRRLLIPVGAGVGSALGFLYAPFSFEATKSFYCKLSNFKANAVRNIFSELENEARSFVKSCNAKTKVISEFKAFMRYKGQGWEIPVVLSQKETKNPKATNLQKLFEKEYTKLFGRSVDDIEIEMTGWSVNTFTIEKTVEKLSAPTLKTFINSNSTRSLYNTKLNKNIEAQIFQRKNLRSGNQIKGPAIITEDETTIILTDSCEATALPDGCIDIIRPKDSNF